MHQPRHTFLRRGLRALLLATLVAGVLVALPATPAAAGDLTVNVSRSGFQQGTVTDDLGQINCGGDCAAFYADNCAFDPDLGRPECDGVEATLTTTVPPGFQPSWTNCAESFDQRSCTVANYLTTSQGRAITVSYTDTSPPVVTSVSTNPAQYVQDSLGVTATASDNDQVARVDYTIFGGGGTAMGGSTSPPYSYTFNTRLLPEGNYTLSATAVDRSGNVSGSITRTVVVDRTGPDLTVDGPGIGFTAESPEFVNSSAAAWSYLASDTRSGIFDVGCFVGVESLDCQPTETRLDLTGLAEGPHSGRFEATDRAGNTTVAGEWNIYVDTIAPETAITSGPKRPVALSRTATFGVSAEDATDVVPACSLNSDEFTPCEDPPTHTNLPSGSHRFQFTAVDAAENQDWSPATWTWTVPHDDRALVASRGWKNLSAGRYYLSTARTTKARKATLSRGSVRARQLYLVASTLPGGGTVDVFYGTQRVKRVKLTSARARHQQVLDVASYARLQPARKLRIVVVSSGKPVIIDGVAIVSK